ncbi:hypothetical protein H5410_044062 [Solanum commersonii]|uniref:Uncharacterized protein n=1 Tax=Solanum commersonii TaxID=4109 RepID=A0A9J5Y2M4_SOLCO|nr:hypothetical protein H5410_044062 [Solanum commersonii]
MAHFQGQTSPRVDLTDEASWPAWLKRPIFIVKQDLEQVNPPFCQFSCAIVLEFFGDPEFRPYFRQDFTCTSIMTLPSDPIGLYGQNGPFSRSKEA